MSEFSREVIQRSGYEREGFANLYDAHRPSPPPARVDGLARSLGGPTTIFGDEAPEVDEAYARVVEIAARRLGDRRRPLLLCFRIRVGITENFA